ncbi:MAG: VWA domain-containing protein [Planctomycetota bacterium]
MKRLATIVSVLVLALGGLAFADTLSAADWKKVENDAAAAIDKSDQEALRAAIDKAATDQSVRALRLVEKIAAANDAAITACIKACQSLEDKKARAELRKDVANLKLPPRVRAMLASSLKGKDADDVPVLLKLIADPLEDVAVPSIRALAEAKVESAVEPLIAAMEKQDAAKGPTWEELRYALTDLLGQKLSSGAEYKSRWTLLKAKGGLKAVGSPDDPTPEPAKQETGKGHAPKTVELFGREVACTRIVFILDTSGSMTAVDDPNLELPKDPGTQGKDPKKPEGGPAGPDPRSRMERAKRELKKVIKGLPKTARVNIVTFGTFVRIWKPGVPSPVLHGLDDATREEAQKFIDTLSADATTATDEALAKAFEVEGARCFYLLSDGIPTKDGTNRIPTEVILKLIEDKNATRKVRIHTLGFKGADPEFMKAVSAATGGEYSDIK